MASPRFTVYAEDGPQIAVFLPQDGHFWPSDRRDPSPDERQGCRNHKGGTGKPTAERGEALPLPEVEGKLEAYKDKQGLPANKVMATLALTELGKLCRDDVITKFNTNRRMKKEPEDNDKAVFVVEVLLGSSSFSTRSWGLGSGFWV